MPVSANFSQTYERYAGLLRDQPLPAMVVDLEAFDHNLQHVLAQLPPDMTLRPATKSIRVRALLERVRAQAREKLIGFMCYSTQEAAKLNDLGFDDLLVAYPPWQRSDLQLAAKFSAQNQVIVLATDSQAAVERIAQAGADSNAIIRVALCIDMSLQMFGGGVHIGVRRSPLRQPDQVLELARFIAKQAHVKLDGLLLYEAQVAGLPDRLPGQPLQNWLKQKLRRHSMAEVAQRREQIVRTLRLDGHELRFVNGGGSGSLGQTAQELGVVTEVTVGSALFKPHLFDHFSDAHMQALIPAAFFALEVTRAPGDRWRTCHGGGYVASGQAWQDRLPQPWLPHGLTLLPHEGAGEVQTPLRLPPDLQLNQGDPVLFRHAKAGELAERFNEVLLVRGDKIVDKVPTYRGEGWNFG